MSTTVSVPTCGNTPAAPVTTARLFSAPLPELLAAANAEIVDTSVTDDTFFGEVLKPRVGTSLVVLPQGRSAGERDTMTRYLVGRLLGTPMLRLPASLEARTFGGAR